MSDNNSPSPDVMSFLDIVRQVGVSTRDSCSPDCSLSMHREEAARYVGAVLADRAVLGSVAARVFPDGAVVLDPDALYRTVDSLAKMIWSLGKIRMDTPADQLLHDRVIAVARESLDPLALACGHPGFPEEYDA